MQQPLIYLALLGFVAGALWLIKKGAVYSPQFFAQVIYSVACTLMLFPHMLAPGQHYELALASQLMTLGISATCLIAVATMRRPEVGDEPAETVWVLLPQRAWLLFFVGMNLIDLALNFLRHGMSRLEQVRDAGRYEAEQGAFTTELAMICTQLAAAMVVTDFYRSRASLKEFLLDRLKIIDVLMVGVCLGTGLICGSRYVFVLVGAIALTMAALYHRVNQRAVLVGGLVVAALFIVIGNYRAGERDIAVNLIRSTGYSSIDMPLAWLVSYAEPVIPNLDAVMNHAPPPRWGTWWVSSVLVGPVRRVMRLEHDTPMFYIFDNRLLPFFGLTFRTFYADFIFDFGPIGSLVLGQLVMLAGGWFYSRAGRTTFSDFALCTTLPTIVFMPLLALPFQFHFCVMACAMFLGSRKV